MSCAGGTVSGKNGSDSGSGGGERRWEWRGKRQLCVSGGGNGRVNGNRSRKRRCAAAAVSKVDLRYWQYNYKKGRTAVVSVRKEGQMVAAVGERQSKKQRRWERQFSVSGGEKDTSAVVAVGEADLR